ncbi:MAG: hypothetical protein GEU75_06250 [Dehalococcoidia bacterium]|nr:hypothetical protein [Dehalococcoidia bacterium]
MLALELGEGDHDRHEQFPLRRRGVVLLLEADELHAVLIDELEEPEEVLHRTAEALERSTKYGVDPPCADRGE